MLVTAYSLTNRRTDMPLTPPLVIAAIVMASFCELREEVPPQPTATTFLTGDLSTSLQEKTTSFKSYRKIVRNTEKYATLRLYEGLPHPSEVQLLLQEKQREDVITIGDWQFYSEPIELTAEDETSIRKIMLKRGAFAAQIGAPGCGGFHPDWCLIWSENGKDRCVAQFCLGCHEIKIADETRAAFGRSKSDKELKELFARYQRNRPKPTNDGGFGGPKPQNATTPER